MKPVEFTPKIKSVEEIIRRYIALDNKRQHHLSNMSKIPSGDEWHKWHSSQFFETCNAMTILGWAIGIECGDKVIPRDGKLIHYDKQK